MATLQHSTQPRLPHSVQGAQCTSVPRGILWSRFVTLASVSGVKSPAARTSLVRSDTQEGCRCFRQGDERRSRSPEGVPDTGHRVGRGHGAWRGLGGQRRRGWLSRACGTRGGVDQGWCCTREVTRRPSQRVCGLGVCVGEVLEEKAYLQKEKKVRFGFLSLWHQSCCWQLVPGLSGTLCPQWVPGQGEGGQGCSGHCCGLGGRSESVFPS